jgi:hypothetical protein
MISYDVSMPHICNNICLTMTAHDAISLDVPEIAATITTFNSLNLVPIFKSPSLPLGIHAKRPSFHVLNWWMEH